MRRLPVKRPSNMSELLDHSGDYPNIEPSPTLDSTAQKMSSNGKMKAISASDPTIQASLFSTIPNEIFLEIEKFAEGHVIMALRGTCSRFMYLFQDPTSDLLNIHEVEKWRRRYTAQRKRYQVVSLCQKERDGELLPNQLACPPCISVHHKKWFEDSEASKQPEKRACIGWTRELQLCSHVSTSFADIHFGTPGHWCGERHSDSKGLLLEYFGPERNILMRRFDLFQPWRHDIAEMRGGGRGVRLGAVGKVDEEGRSLSLFDRVEANNIQRRRLTADREVVIRAEIVLFTFDGDKRISGQQVSASIKETWENEKGLGMCPHITLSVISKMLENKPYSDCPDYSHHGPEILPCQSHVIVQPRRLSFFSWSPQRSACDERYCCPHPDCMTEFYFHRVQFEGFTRERRNELLLCVVRRLGHCYNARNRRWLAQIGVDPSNPT